MISRSSFQRGHISTAAVVVAIMGWVSPASIQAQAEPLVEEVVVTGSRTPQASTFVEADPTTTLTGDDIALSRSSVIEELFKRTPSVDFNGGASKSSTADGQSVVGLRNVGAQRTLVLLDGERLIPITGSNVDLNVIALSVVDHVEILKDGASSIYGADAIGGVINIITKKDAEGGTLNAGFGESTYGDGATYNVDGSFALKSDRGALLLGFDWDHRNPIQQSDRSWATALHANDPNFPGGSAWRTQLDVLQNENDVSQVWINGLQRSTHDPSIAGLAPNLAYVAAAGAVKLNAGGPGWGYLTSGLGRAQINALGHLDLTPAIRIVADGFASDYTGRQSLRPEPLLGDTIATSVFPGFIIPAGLDGNATAQPLTAYLTPTQFGPRRYDSDYRTYRARVGLEGKAWARFNWDLGYVYQTNVATLSVDNEGNFLHLAELTGQAPCVDVPGGCFNGLPTSSAQVNFFNGPNIFTASQVAYLTFKNTTLSHANERYAYSHFNGPLFNLPSGEVFGALGFESRTEHFDTTPSLLVQQGWAPNQQQPTRGGYDVQSVYGEVRIPLLNNLPFINSLSLNPSFRYDDYSSFGGKTTYKVGLDYDINNELLFHGAYATEIRAPNVFELFSGTAVSDNGAGGDPCETNPAHSAAVSHNTNLGKGILSAGSTCSKAIAGGAAVSNFHDVLDDLPNNQLAVLTGGNPKLEPETGRTFTAGFVLKPRWFSGLSLAASFYDIVITNTVLAGGVAGTQGADLILNGCYGPAQNLTYCGLIKRDASGNIVQINSLNANSGVAIARGLDYKISYNFKAADLSLPVSGDVKLELDVSNQIKNTLSNPDGSITNFNGFFNSNNESVQPKWKGVFVLDYAYTSWQFRYETRYASATSNIDATPAVYGNQTPDLWYHDISASYRLPGWSALKGERVIIGIDNLFNLAPPFIGNDSTCKCNTISGPYDPTGRYVYTKISAQF